MPSGTIGLSWRKIADDPRVGLRYVTAQVLQLVSDERAAMEGAHRDEADLAVREFEHLQRLGELEQLGDIVANHLLGTDGMVHREILRREDLGVREIVRGADACDLGRDVEHGGGELARDHVDLVALRDREQHVRVSRAGLLQHRRLRGVAGHGPQIETVLQSLQPRGVDIDDGNVVCFGYEVLGDRGTDLPGAKNDDAHIMLGEVKGNGILCFFAGAHKASRSR